MKVDQFVLNNSTRYLTRKQWKDIFGLWVKLPPVTPCLTTQRYRQSWVQGHKRTCHLGLHTISLRLNVKQRIFKFFGLTQQGNWTQVYRLSDWCFIY